VRGDEGHFRHFLAKELLDVGKSAMRGATKKLWPAAIMFAKQRLAKHHRVPGHDIGAHRQAVDRRRLDHRELAKARHRHLQRARDRAWR
jgi:hypothetical protein